MTKHVYDFGSVFLPSTLLPQVVTGLVNNAVTGMVHEEGLKVRLEGDEKAYYMQVVVILEEVGDVGDF